VDNNHTECTTGKWQRGLFPIAATLLILCGCIAVAYWGYEKMTHPEEEMYAVAGGRNIIIENF